MNTCKVQYVHHILGAIEDFLVYEDEITLENLEAYVKREIPEVTQDFSLETYFVNSVEFKETFEMQSDLYGFPIGDFIKKTDAISIKTKSNIAPNFTSSQIANLFHTLPLVKSNFEDQMNSNILKEILIGKGTNSKYVSSDEEISNNLTEFKGRLFQEIQEFLVKEKVKGLTQKQIQPLYNDQKDLVDYAHYQKVMLLLDDYFFKNEKFKLINTYSNKKGIPNLSLDLVANEDIFNAYNAGILLTNFDTVLQEYFAGIININYNLFNNLRTNLSSGNKYSLKIEGLQTEFWRKDTHAAEGSESAEGKLVRLLVTTVPYLNKRGTDLGIKMEMKDFYLFAAQIGDFEVMYGNKLKSTPGLNFRYLNEDPGEVLLWYLNEIGKAINDEAGSITFLKDHFHKTYEFAASLNKYFHSEDLNILEKEKNSSISLVTILSQIVNNNFGALYYKYNSDGNYTINEMYKQNFNTIHLQDTTFSHMRRVSSKKVYDPLIYKAEITEVMEGITDEGLKSIENLDVKLRIKIANFIKNKTGIKLSYLGVNELVKDWEPIVAKRSVVGFKNRLIDLLGALHIDAEIIDKARDSFKKQSKGDVSIIQYMPNTVSNSLYIAIMNAHLLNHVMKPVMNVSLLSGEKLPTFKMATLTQKDSELFELQRKFELENAESNSYRNLLVKNYDVEDKIPPCVILGTGTKLELINDDYNKQAAKFTVSENFISDFQFDFLQNIITKGQFSVMLGNYSDKNTILTKIINGNLKIKDKTPLIKMSTNAVLDLVRTQGQSYYKDTLNKIFQDYAKLLNIKLSLETMPEENIKKINKALLNINIRDLAKSASDLKINLTEELHYSLYKNPNWVKGSKTEKEYVTGLNQLLVDNFRIFNNPAIFSKFIARQEKSMLSKFGEFNKSVNGGTAINFAGDIKIEEALKQLNIKKEEFDKEGKEFDYTKLEGKSGLNPLLKRWMWLNALMRNEYMFLSGKGEYMHPHKLKGNLMYRGNTLDISAKSTDLPETYWAELEKEMSGRLISMAKRNVMFTATIEVPVRKSKLGVPDQINMATIEDHKSLVYNIGGTTKNQEVHDGSSFIPYIYSLLLDNSYPSKGFSGTKKQFGTLITKHGVSIKKDAESVITNDRIIDSKNSEIKFYDKQKQSLNLPIGFLTGFEFNEVFSDEFFYNKLGKTYRINQLKIENNKYTMLVSQKIGETWTSLPEPIEGNFNTLFDLWNLFGAEYSTNEKGAFNEGSNDLLFKVITTPSKIEGKPDTYPLKDKMIHIISTLSAVKAGGTNVNGRKAWTSDKDLAYYAFESRMMGPQLDASHEADESEIKEVTQVISALAQNSQTAHLAMEAYQNIANVIENAARPYLRYMKDGENINKTGLYKYLSDKFVKTIENSKGDTIAKVLVQAFKDDVNIPFSNQNFFVPFVRDIITRMNNEFITRHYSGTGAVLIPSHGMIQLYDVPQADGTSQIITQGDLVKQALNNFDETQYITSKDKVIWGHPGIGKTFLHLNRNTNIVDFDSVYKPRINRELGLPEGVDGLTARQEFRKKSPEIYKQKILELWNHAKADAKISGKTLLASDLILLEEFSNDFDKIINMTAGTFVERSRQRGETDAEDKLKWKAGIDAALQKVDAAKIFTTDKYISDLIINTNDDIIKSHINSMLKEVKTTWDMIQLGDTIERPKAELAVMLKKEFDYIVEQEFQTQQSIDIFMHGRTEALKYITLSTPELYYEYKTTQTFAPLQEGEVFDPKQPVVKILNKPRDLKPSEITYTIAEIQKNAFDMDSINLKYAFSVFAQQIKDGITIDKADHKFITLSNLYLHFTEKDLLISLIADYQGTTEVLNDTLNKWTQRNLDLLDIGRVMKEIDSTVDFKDFFNGDTLRTNFKDAIAKYTDYNSIGVANYKFNPAELMLGDIYQSKFSRDFEDSIFEIKQQGSKYFENRLSENYVSDPINADIKLQLSNYDRPIYIRYMDSLPGNDYRLNITLERPLEEEGVQQRFVRRNQNGEILYVLPDPQNVRVGLDPDGNEIIYIKAATKVKARGSYIFVEDADFNKNLAKLIASFKGTITALVPLMNNNLKLTEETEEELMKDGKVLPRKRTLNQTTLKAFSRFSGYNTTSDNPTTGWFEQNKADIISQLGKKMFASWEKSHEFVAARIPSQSMQSFMEMKNVAYLKTKSNDAYVSVWQIWLQGSDFDIDKAYILGSGFSSNGQFDTWSPISNYSTLEQLNVLERFPLPNKTEVTYKAKGGIDISQEVADFFSTTIDDLNKLATSTNVMSDLDKKAFLKELSTKQLLAVNSALRKINGTNTSTLAELKGKIGIKSNVTFSGSSDQVEIFTTLLNNYNASALYLDRPHALKNLVASTIKQIISAPSNQLLANTPIDIDDWHKAANDAIKRKGKPPISLSSYDMFSMYKQQKDASVGNDDVGIAANGLKSFFALSAYYNNYFENNFPNRVIDLRRSNKTFLKSFTFMGAEGTKTYKLANIADISISEVQNEKLVESIGDFENNKTNAALALSGFTSAATDNAKELLMAKINASVELASMHIYLMILGFTPAQVAEIMTSTVMDDVIERLEVNAFFVKKQPSVAVIFNKLIAEYKDAKNEIMLANALSLREIFQGAQEVKLLSSFLAANQKTSANVEKINDFLTNFETAIYAREYHVFGHALKDFETWSNYKDSTDPERAVDAEKKFDNLVNLVFKNNPNLNKELDVDYVKRVLKSATELKITGGEFDFQVYFGREKKDANGKLKPKADTYKEVTKEYYNLIKNTFNLFDVIDEVPHFREMINGLVLSHTILLNTSIKYNTAFSLIKDTIRKHSNRIVIEANPHIVNQMGNPALYPMINDVMVTKGIAGIDIRLKSEWLKTQSTEAYSFNVTDLIKKLNVINTSLKQPLLKDFVVYSTDDARESDKIDENSKKVNETDTEDTIIKLDTNHGIANFKRLMENVLLPMLHTKSNVLLDSLKVQGEVFNILGIRTNSITSTFDMGSLNSAVSKDKAQKLIKAFNELDINDSTKDMISNTSNKTLKWRDLFYVYNLLVNNERYGSNRLTPLFIDYVKEEDSLGYDYVMFSSKIDNGDLNLYDLQRDLDNNPEYQIAVTNKDIKEIARLTAKGQRELENDILFYSLNKNGILHLKNAPLNDVLSVTNGDFVVVTSMSESTEVKKQWAALYEVMKLIRSRGYIIKFKC